MALRQEKDSSTHAPSRAAVNLRDVSLTYGQGVGAAKVLDRVSLEIPEGAFISLIGPSGCGKTTLLRVVADLVQPGSGTVLVLDQSASQVRRSRGYGYVFQSSALLSWRTCRDNVRLPLQVMGWPRARQDEACDTALRTVGLTDAAGRYPFELSGGMQQRVSIARALAFAPRLMLMDEPFGALDEITRDGLNLHLHRLWAEGGMTVIFVTHSISEAAFLSTHIAVMAARPGRIVDTIVSDLPATRTAATRETPEFQRLCSRMRDALEESHSDA